MTFKLQIIFYLQGSSFSGGPDRYYQGDDDDGQTCENEIQGLHFYRIRIYYGGGHAHGNEIERLLRPADEHTRCQANKSAAKRYNGAFQQEYIPDNVGAGSHGS